MINTRNKTVAEIALAIISFVTICLIYFVWIPGRYADASTAIYRPLIYVVFAVLLPALLFGVRDFAQKYGYRRDGLAKSAVIALALALPVALLGYKVAAGPLPSSWSLLLAWYVLIVLEETYFRGLWQRAGAHVVGPQGAIFVQAVMFGIYHLTLGFTSLQALGVVLFGLLLGWLRKSTDNILGAVLLHAALATGMWLSVQ